MKKHLLSLLSAVAGISLLVSGSALALDRAQIADAAENVTPLLNGQPAPSATLKTADGAPVSLKALTMQKPSIVLFYRGGWCPYCNRQLAELKNIESDLIALGYQVLAISPESPTRLQEQKLETEFAVTLLSDESLDTIRGFGVGFYVEDETTKLYKEKMDVDLTQDTNAKSVLPAPAVFFVNTDGLIEFSYVNPNYRVRPSAELLLGAAKALKKASD
ncbi:peroxiredoxin-like family protein [Alteromonas oceanisediminis]|uniref:peroxiredoxin-like family protein n=1 Tax=Alteromonas oceanisediminis TaxID=2836180 RepID=UPI001BDAE90B|nr:peroxiredoxin-like family protein [Alteromonas oceanisediminis]MBT0586806.1 AhpC/TSA family protein [Alteromonas oceanisediminis]